MSTKIRRNSSKPYGMTTNRNGSCDNGILISNGNGTIPNVMTSPAIFTSEDMEAKHFRSHADDLADIEEDSFTASSVTDVPKPPDGGWGWMVVLASFMIHVLGKKQKTFLIDTDISAERKVSFEKTRKAFLWHFKTLPFLLYYSITFFPEIPK